ncbi:7,8-didemethyl-8-hydroxy-5-deazariboflavin synthase subunit CofH [Bradyrhizobium sacchari]|uniref:FO synthase subunit 2 n=1 Tax=Bradyrhizobium sacchari TaxID=1399419 RepID=A0A560JE08_9BRAD|nr:5-amino-6-(D-ribitylamino)uracil--L-tyrosine 4-hydroxyphenyl transferase CofH [Bradyrhizobium sacchari]OPY96642.1 7,8-didemethyl-8-hydroxy-5-deazariboflavin synthase subunit CofH [Bradyrhizobium sacchari]TWB51194.1 FO synthase subunit 2 [Bradyrhizobium sacchari]TWB69428.1 FO synthase subunit 2 [Bradyrhizobium sacchari]
MHSAQPFKPSTLRAKSWEALLSQSSRQVRHILEGALLGREVTRQDGETLFGAASADLPAIVRAADIVREQRVGDRASFVIVRNVNFTNVCYMGCRFCGFAKRKEDPDAVWYSMDEVAHRAQVAWDRGATEVCMQGGLHPDLPPTYYRDLLIAVKRQVPRMHVHAFSPFEVWFGAHKRKMSTREFLLELRAAGLGSMPGTAAEILDVEVRRKLTRNKLTTEAWVDTIRAAHSIGLRSTSTIMFGHIDGPSHWAAHIDLIRSIQKETGGFTEFVPLSFVYAESPLYVDRAIPGVRAGATQEENFKMHAIARLMLAGWIDNIQVSWVKLGAQMAAEMLHAGVNDLGGTLMDESISRSAGADFGEELTPVEMVRLIRHAGRTPVRRSTLYETLEEFSDHEPVDIGPLKPRPHDPIDFLRHRYVAAE